MKTIKILLLLLATSISYSQVGIGTTTPDASAVLDLTSLNSGLLLPRLNKSDIQNPKNGLQVYDLETNMVCYYSNGWKCFSNGSGNSSENAVTTFFNQTAFASLNSQVVIYGNLLKNQNLSISPTTSNVSPFVTPCGGGCDASQYALVSQGSHILGLSIRRGNSSVNGNYVTVRALVNGVIVNEEIFNLPNINTGDIVPFQFNFNCSSQAQIQIQGGNGLQDAQIKFNYLQTR